MNSRLLSPFQLFAICAASSMLGVFVTSGGSFTPVYFWTVISLFLLQSGGIVLLGRSFERTGCRDASEHMTDLLSAPAARILLALLGVLLAARSAVALASQTDCVSLYLLEDTPPVIIALTLLTTAFFTLLPGLRRLSGVSTLLTLILPLILAVIIAVGLMGADPGELRALYQPAASELRKAVVPAALTASGAECTLFFLGWRESGRRSLRAAAAAPAVCAVIFAILTCTALGTIGIGGMNGRTFPLVEAARQISLGGIELTERFDLPLIIVSLFASAVQIAVFTLCASISLCSAFGSAKTGRAALLLLPAELILALYLRAVADAPAVLTVCAIGSTAFGAVFFPLLALISVIRHREVSYQ